MADAYDNYRKQAKELADSMEKAPNEVSQEVLWVKAAATIRINEVETFTENGKFVFSEGFANLLIYYAIAEGRKRERASMQKMYDDAQVHNSAAIKGILKALEDNDLLPECEGDCEHSQY